MQSTLREMTRMIVRPRYWIVFAAVVALFTITGPFGTYLRLDFLPRLGYWLVVQTGAWGIALVFISASIVRLENSTWPFFLHIFIGSAVAAIPIAIWVVAINSVVFDIGISWQELGANVLISAPVAVAIGLVTWMFAEPPELPSPGTEPAPLMQRLPVELRGPLVRISVQDHYSEVVTTKGSHLVLLRFSDALNETGDQAGMQVHRSHWVADAAVTALRRSDGRLTIRTSDDVDIPVSRTYAPDVRKAYAGKAG